MLVVSVLSVYNHCCRSTVAMVASMEVGAGAIMCSMHH